MEAVQGGNKVYTKVLYTALQDGEVIKIGEGDNLVVVRVNKLSHERIKVSVRAPSALLIQRGEQRANCRENQEQGDGQQGPIRDCG